MGAESKLPYQASDRVKLHTRHRILTLLYEPRCAREIRERLTGTKRKQVEASIQRLAQDRLIECVTPGLRQSRLYQRTYLGELLVFELTGEHPEPRNERSGQVLYTRSFVQSGRYRRLVLQAMGGGQPPKKAREIRKSVLPIYQRIGIGHTHHALRELEIQHVVERDENGCWSLTELGEELWTIEIDGLPERPTISGPLWEKIEPQEQLVQDEDPDRDHDDPTE